MSPVTSIVYTYTTPYRKKKTVCFVCMLFRLGSQDEASGRPGKRSLFLSMHEKECKGEKEGGVWEG